MANGVEYFEIPADEAGELKEFYSSLFGWQFEQSEMADYWYIKNADISGGLAPKETPGQMPTVFVDVESIDDYLEKAEKLGAEVVKGMQEMSNGYFAVLEDPQGNTFGIWQDKK
ncbi:MAG: VOC family protein [Nitrososphaera sp.]|uniref:VOC family protein n=1 Tax=Nitrososphaera sp. TaxID=1971748 RepID=UPI003D6E40CF